MRHSPLVWLTRVFGWGMLALLLVYLISAVLTISFSWPGPAALIRGDFSLQGLIQSLLYVGAIVFAVQHVMRHEAVRSEATVSLSHASMPG